MAGKTVYRGNTIEEKKEGSKNNLYVNGKKISVKKSDELKDGFKSSYSYLPAPNLEDLGKLIIDNQLSLTKPTLASMKKEK